MESDWSVLKAQEPCESPGGRPGLPVLFGFIISLVVSVDVKHHENRKSIFRAQELCESCDGRSGFHVRNIKPCGFCGRKSP